MMTFEQYLNDLNEKKVTNTLILQVGNFVFIPVNEVKKNTYDVFNVTTKDTEKTLDNYKPKDYYLWSNYNSVIFLEKGSKPPLKKDISSYIISNEYMTFKSKVLADLEKVVNQKGKTKIPQNDDIYACALFFDLRQQLTLKRKTKSYLEKLDIDIDTETRSVLEFFCPSYCIDEVKSIINTLNNGSYISDYPE